MAKPPYDLKTDGSWQRYCTAELHRCIGLGGETGRKEWNRLRNNLSTISRIIIADSDFSGKSIEGYDLRYCYFARNKLVGSKISKSKFNQSIFVECNFSQSDVGGADFSEASIRSETIFSDISWNEQTNFHIKKGPLPSTIDISIKEKITKAWRISEFHNGQSHIITKLFAKIIGHGESFSPLFVIAILIIILFACIFFLLGSSDVRFASDTTLDFTLNSARYFLLLSDPYEGKSNILSILGMIEGALGLTFLALLITSITKKFTL